MADNKLTLGSLSTVLAIVVTTLPLSTSSSRCNTAPYWQETDTPSIYYCEYSDNYRACTLLSSTNKTCYHIVNASQANVTCSGYELDWEFIEDDPDIQVKTIQGEKVIDFGGDFIRKEEIEMGFENQEGAVIFDDIYDGNGDGVCSDGEICCILTDKVECMEHNAFRLESRLKQVGLE
jgi:hypothetical protein